MAFRPQRLREHLRHNSYQTTVLNSRTAGQRLHTDRTYWTSHYENQTISPKLETIATALICVKARRFVTQTVSSRPSEDSPGEKKDADDSAAQQRDQENDET